MLYFYIENNEQKGPFNLEEMQKLSIKKDTLIWYEGLDDWTEAQNIKGFESFIFNTVPPKIPVTSKEPPKFQDPSSKVSQESKPEVKKSNNLKNVILLSSIATVLFIGIYLFVNSNTSNGKNDESVFTDEEKAYLNNNSVYKNESNYSNSNNQQPKSQKQRQLTEEEIRVNLYNKEVSNPVNYLIVSGSYRVNLAANTVIEGTIYNNASIAGFKNINITAKFYSKTDVLLGEESFLVMDFISPNGKLAFKSKIYGWWKNIDHWTLDVNSAEAY